MPSFSSSARKTDFRRNVRYPMTGMLRIIWQDGTGREKISNAQLVNISTKGMQLRVNEKMPLRSYVSCNDETLHIRGTGTVRYCNFVKGKYEIGLEFSGGTGWREPVKPSAGISAPAEDS